MLFVVCLMQGWSCRSTGLTLTKCLSLNYSCTTIFISVTFAVCAVHCGPFLWEAHMFKASTVYQSYYCIVICLHSWCLRTSAHFSHPNLLSNIPTSAPWIWDVLFAFIHFCPLVLFIAKSCF